MSEKTGSDRKNSDLALTLRTSVEIAIRLGAIALLLAACVMIIAPFLGIVVWALIMAIAADGPYEAMCRWMGGRRKLAAFVAVVLALRVLIVPAVMLSETMISGAQGVYDKFAVNTDTGEDAGQMRISPPDDSVKEWPVIGGLVHRIWTRASENLPDLLTRLGPQLKAISGWLLNAAGAAGAGILQLIGSILIAGVMLVRGHKRRATVEQLSVRLAGPGRGPDLARLATATVRSVVQGIVGVAALQAILAGGGLMVAGVPAAGLWALLVLVAAVVQLPVTLVLVAPVIYAFTSIGGATAIILTIWLVFVGLIDNFLKPILFGRGVEVPSLIIFIGSLGGMLSMGIMGLFLGSVVLAVGYALFKAWLEVPGTDGDAQAEAGSAAIA